MIRTRAGVGLILPNDLDEALKDIRIHRQRGLRGGVLLRWSRRTARG